MLYFRDPDGRFVVHHSIIRYIHLHEQWHSVMALKTMADLTREDGCIKDNLLIKKFDKARQVLQDCLDLLTREMFILEPMARQHGIRQGLLISSNQEIV